MISDDAGQAFADPGAGLRPGHLLRQPARRISLDDLGMLFRQDLSDRAADFLRQPAIGLAAAVKPPGIAPAPDHPAEVETGIRHEEDPGARNEQRAASTPRTRRATPSRLTPAGEAGNQAMRPSGSDTTHRSSRASMVSASAA
jgi:hypothetical protein